MLHTISRVVTPLIKTTQSTFITYFLLLFSRWVRSCLCLLLLAMPLSAHAINSGQTVVSTIITIDGSDYYPVQVSAGESIEARVRGLNPDQNFLVKLYNSANAQQETNISGSKITFRASVSDIYSIAVNASNDEVGAYVLSYLKSQAATENGELASGSTMVKNLDGGYLDSYSFELNVGESCEFRIRSEVPAPSGFNPRFRLYNPAGVEIQGSNESFRGTASISGTYTAAIVDSGNDATGIYYLSYLRAPGAVENGELLSGTTKVKLLDGGYMDSYSLQLNAGDGVEFRIRPDDNANSNFNPRIRLYNPTGSIFVDYDDSFVTTAAMTGNYTVLIGDSQNNATGIYHLSYVRAPGAVGNGDLDVGSSTIKTLDGGYLDSYRAYADIGDQISLAIDEVAPVPSGFNARFHLFDPEGTLLTQFGVSSKSLTASKAGYYTVAVFDSLNNATGDYQLSFDRSCQLPGDVNLDCELTISDALLMEKAILNKQTLSQAQEDSADLYPEGNPDGVIDNSDLLLLNNLLLQKL